VTGPSTRREGPEIEALVTDRYLEALLAAHAHGADHAPTLVEPSDPIRRTADRLARDLPRFHPSFRFEEALAARLGDVAARMGLGAAAGGDDSLFPLPEDASWLDRRDDRDLERSPLAYGRRPLIIGGALTSAALSLAGAAFVAWRRSRPPASPMVRAARAVARTRPV
jgi:hypothetical protein